MSSKRGKFLHKDNIEKIVRYTEKTYKIDIPDEYIDNDLPTVMRYVFSTLSSLDGKSASIDELNLAVSKAIRGELTKKKEKPSVEGLDYEVMDKYDKDRKFVSTPARDGVPGMPLFVSEEMVASVPSMDYALLPNMREEFIAVDSRDRDPSRNPNSSKFRMTLWEDLNGKTAGFIRNATRLNRIIIIELVSAIIPNIAIPNQTYTIFGDPGLFIAIEELKSNMRSSAYHGRTHFGRLEYNITQAYSSQSPRINAIIYGCKQFYQLSHPFSKLDSMSITLMNYRGQDFSFGIDGISILSITGGAATTVVTNTVHSLTTGDAVYIVSLNATDESTDQALTSSKQYVSVTDNVTFTLPNVTLGAAYTYTAGYVLRDRLQCSFIFRVLMVGEENKSSGRRPKEKI